MITDLDRAYMAGIIDGEGAIQISVTKKQGRTAVHRLTVSVGTTDIEAMQALGELWGRTAIVVHPKGEGNLRSWAKLQWQSAMAANFLRELRPFLRLKAKHADIALAFADELNPESDRAVRITPERWERREELRAQLSAIQVKRPRRLGVVQPLPKPERDVHTLQCARCDKPFDTVDIRVLYCSNHCAKAVQYQREKLKADIERNCPSCNVTFVTHRARQQFCSIRCGLSERKTHLDARPELQPTCIKCGSLFTTTNPLQRYCGWNCRQQVYRHRKAAALREAIPGG